MSLATRIATGATAALLSTAGLVTAGAAPASAAVNQANCTFSFFRPFRVAANCYNSTNSAWYLEATCARGSEMFAPAIGRSHIVKGWLVYGSGISMAQCARGTEHLEGFQIVNV